MEKPVPDGTIGRGAGRRGARPLVLDAAPLSPRDLDATGLPLSLLTDIALRFLYIRGLASGIELAANLRLPWKGVVEQLVDVLVKEHWVEVRGGKGFGRVSVDLTLTERGRSNAQEAMTRSSYAGPAPVPIDEYDRVTLRMASEPFGMSRDELSAALRPLVLPDGMLDILGPAMSTKRSLLLFGHPGNGKTTIAELVGSAMRGEIFVPHAVTVDGQIIKVFDPHVHLPIEDSETLALLDDEKIDLDRRWSVCGRPCVVVGGELTMEALDLVWNAAARFYEAPVQMKANGGMLLIDDLGRQRVAPVDLLNRWIVPLEKHVDYLTLHTGKKFDVPFDELVVFCTNLEPSELVDEAFLRRIKYKIRVPSPSEAAFRLIFERMCEKLGIAYEEAAVTHLLQAHYGAQGSKLRSCHPRDILTLVCDFARFLGTPPSLRRELIDRACATFFVNEEE